MNKLNQNTLDWLLEDDNPGVQYLARKNLLGESPRSRKLRSLRRRCNEYPPVAGMTGRSAETFEQRQYKKYEGAHWTLLFLAEMMADGRDPQIRDLAEYVMQTQIANGGFSTDGKSRYEIVCLTANMLRALVTLGFKKDRRVRRGYARLTERILGHKGVPCLVLETSLQTACKMTLPQTLRSLSCAPASLDPRRIQKAKRVLIKDMLAVGIFKYARPDYPEYQKAVAAREAGSTERDVRNRWVADHPISADRLRPKQSWLRFGFPNSYNPDLLEALLGLAEAGARKTEAVRNALDIVEKKRLASGQWMMEKSLNGKMLADVEKTGKPSKWVTLRALVVLKYFGRPR